MYSRPLHDFGGVKPHSPNVRKASTITSHPAFEAVILMLLRWLVLYVIATRSAPDLIPMPC